MKISLNSFFAKVAMIAVSGFSIAVTAFGQTTYKLQQVTSVSAGGKYVFEQEGHVMNNNVSSSALQTTATYNTTGLNGSESYVWTLESANGGFYLKNVSLNSNQYLNNTSSTSVSFGSKNSIWAISFTDGIALISNKSNSDRFLGYTNATSYAYKAYATNNMASYAHAITVYELAEEGASSAVETVTSISDAQITNTDVFISTEAGSLTASVTAGGNPLQNPAITWSGSDDEVATINATTGAVTLVSAGSVTFTASYAGVSGTYKASSDTYQMTVTSSAPYVQPTSIVANFNDTFFGTSYGGNAAGITDDSPIIGSQDNVTITYAGSGNHYVNDSQIRFYPNNKLTFEAPDGYEIKSIVFTSAGTWAATISADCGTYTSNPKTWTGSAETVVFTGSGSSRCDISKATITIGEPSVSVATPTFSPAAGVYASAQNVAISCTTEGATIYYTTDGSTPTTSSSVYSSAISVNSTMTIKAIATKETYTNSSVASATYTIVSHSGSELDPYTVADARTVIDAGVGITNVYVTGIVSQVDSYNSTYKSITYWISGDGTTSSPQLEVYGGKGLDNADFSSLGDVEVGATVIIYGTLKKYQETYEFDKDNYLTSYIAPAGPTITISPTTLSSFTYEEGDGPSSAKSFSVSGSNLTASISMSLNDNSDFEISLTEDSDYTSALELTPTAGEVANTTIYARLKSGKTGGNYVGTITLVSTGATDRAINLSGTVTATAVTSLPFAFDEGKNAIAIKSGLSHSGLGDDYNSSPKLKFDTTGDFLLLQFNERPGVLTYHIKGNGFSSGSTSTFKVQASVDGESYTDLKTYTELSEEDETIDDLSENVRYIKWVYTEKGASNGGNVALGNIALAKYVDPLTIPSISLDSYTIDAPAAETGGTLVITYNNLAVSDMNDFGIQYYDDGDNEISEPAWIEVLVAAQDPSIGEGYVVSYYMIDNDGAARNAFFKVYAMDNESNLVYSNLVTVTQAKANPIPAGWEEETLDGLTENDVFVIVGINNAGDCFAMSNDNGTSDAPAAVELMGTIPSNVKWNIGGDAVNGYVFYPNGTTEKWLYCTDTNNGVRVGTNANNAFTLSEGYLLNDATSRYVGVYNAQDWRCYGTNGGNIANQTFKFYKRVVSNTVEPTITVTATESDGRFWATFYNAEAQYVLPEGAQAFTMNVDKELYRVGKDGRVIPENTPVIIIADKASLTLTQKNAGDGTIHDDALTPVNILRGSSSAVATSSITPGTPYVLGIVGGKLGFYEYTGSNIPANKAYYVVE